MTTDRLVRSQDSWVRKWLSIYATGFAVLVALVVGGLLVAGNGNLKSPETRFALGLNIIASALFALVFALFATWVLDRNSRTASQEAVRAEFGSLQVHVAGLAPKFLPLAEFPASEDFEAEFNHRLMKAMNGSRHYDFYGPSARFVAARLRLVRKCPQLIRVAMIDPGLKPSVMRRAADREKWRSSQGKTLEEIEREFRNEIAMTIVSLFDFRHTCPVDLVYTNDTVVYRMELTDDSLFFSWYHGPQSSGKEMPEAVQFGSGSLYYQVLRQEMTRRYEVIDRKVHFDSSQSDGDLLTHLRSMTGRDLGAQDLVRLRREYGEYTRPLVKFLRGLGY